MTMIETGVLPTPPLCGRSAKQFRRVPRGVILFLILRIDRSRSCTLSRVSALHPVTCQRPLSLRPGARCGGRVLTSQLPSRAPTPKRAVGAIQYIKIKGNNYHSSTCSLCPCNVDVVVHVVHGVRAVECGHVVRFKAGVEMNQVSRYLGTWHCLAAKTPLLTTCK